MRDGFRYVCRVACTRGLIMEACVPLEPVSVLLSRPRFWNIESCNFITPTFLVSMQLSSLWHKSTMHPRLCWSQLMSTM